MPSPMLGAFPSTTFTHVLLSPQGEGVPSTRTRLICAFVGGSRGLLRPSPAQTTPPRIPQDQKSWSLWRWTFETVSSRKNRDALEGRRCEGGGAFRGPARRERSATAAGARRAPLPRHAASARVRARTRARTCPSHGLGGGDPPGGGWAAEVRGEEPELWRCCRCCRRHCRRPREEHVCNSSQESEDGHQIVSRVRPTENKHEAKRRRTERVRREKINSTVNKDLENRKRSRSNSHSDHIRRGRGRPKTASAKKHEEEREKQEKEIDIYANLSDEKAFVFSVALAEINRKIINQRLIL
uniref:IBB domain-containing protein n=2 Tax=Felinae TaxID=338152 RepID=A0ABI7W5Y1_FELCA